MVTDHPARPLLTLVTTEDHRAEHRHPVLDDDDGDDRQCGQCRFTFAVDEPARAEPAWWLCPPCTLASLGGGSLQQRTLVTNGSLTQRTVFQR